MISVLLCKTEFMSGSISRGKYSMTGDVIEPNVEATFIGLLDGLDVAVKLSSKHLCFCTQISVAVSLNS